MHLVTIEKKKKELDLAEINCELEQIADLQTQLTVAIPLMVSLDGKGIIHKQVELSGKEESNELLGKVLPNAHPNDFYLQKTQLENNTYWVSIARKEFVDQLLKDISATGCYVHDLLLGPFSLHTAMIAMDNEPQPDVIVDETTEIHFSGKEISGMVSSAENNAQPTYLVSGHSMNSAGLIAFGNAFQYFLKDVKIVRPFYQLVHEKANDFFQRRLFRIGGVSLLSFFLLALLINFLIFDHYNSAYQTLISNVHQNEAQLEKLNTLKQEVQRQKEFIKESGFTNASKISFVADQLAESVPRSIQLIHLAINPVVRKKKAADKTAFLFNEIQLTGKTTESVELNEWIKLTKSKPWVKEVNIIDFNREKKKSTAFFELQIIVDKEHV